MSERTYWFWMRVPNPEEIIKEVAGRHGLTAADLRSDTRRRAISRPRQEAMWELRKRTKLSFPQIARRLNRTDHTTAIHAVRAHERRLAALA